MILTEVAARRRPIQPYSAQFLHRNAVSWELGVNGEAAHELGVEERLCLAGQSSPTAVRIDSFSSDRFLAAHTILLDPLPPQERRRLGVGMNGEAAHELDVEKTLVTPGKVLQPQNEILIFRICWKRVEDFRSLQIFKSSRRGRESRCS